MASGDNEEGSGGLFENSPEVLSLANPKAINVLLGLLPEMEPEERLSVIEAILSIGEQILPRNIIGTFASGNLLGLIVFSVLFGKALAKQGAKSEPIFEMVQTCADALMSVVMSVVEFTPLGVGSLIAKGIAGMGDGSLAPYATFIVMALLAQLCHLAILFGVLTTCAPGCDAKEYYSNLRPAMIMAMATDSSAATLPVTMACAKVNRLRQRTIDLIFPLGTYSTHTWPAP